MIIFLIVIIFYLILKTSKTTKDFNYQNYKTEETSASHVKKNGNHYKNKKRSYIPSKTNKQHNKIPVIFLDIATNGLSSNYSVLSISATKAMIDYDNSHIELIDTYERFYYPVEKLSEDVININKLNIEAIAKHRKNAKYPRYFKYDQNSFLKFTDGTDHFIAHNIAFIQQFFDFKLRKKFCTMKSNTSILKLLQPKGKKGYKYPKLIEIAQFYGIEFNKNDFHISSYDVEILIQIFEQMLKKGYADKKIYSFLFNIYFLKYN